MEFLTCRALGNNLINLMVKKRSGRGLEELGISYNDIEEEPDPGLGNGGLGRLAACFRFFVNFRLSGLWMWDKI